MKKPAYYNDWRETANPDIEYSPGADLYWHKKEHRIRDKRSASWAGWIGFGWDLKQMAKQTH